jgi:hypothetical protein
LLYKFRSRFDKRPTAINISKDTTKPKLNNTYNNQSRNRTALDNIPSEISHLERLKNKIKDIEDKIGGLGQDKHNSFNYSIK